MRLRVQRMHSSAKESSLHRIDLRGLYKKLRQSLLVKRRLNPSYSSEYSIGLFKTYDSRSAITWIRPAIAMTDLTTVEVPKIGLVTYRIAIGADERSQIRPLVGKALIPRHRRAERLHGGSDRLSASRHTCPHSANDTNNNWRSEHTSSDAISDPALQHEKARGPFSRFHHQYRPCSSVRRCSGTSQPAEYRQRSSYHNGSTNNSSAILCSRTRQQPCARRNLDDRPWPRWDRPEHICQR